MSWLTSLFTRKSPLSSRSNMNRINATSTTGVNPMYNTSAIEPHVSKLIQGYKKQNTRIFNTAIPPIRNYFKTHPSQVNSYLQTRFNRSQSDLSDMSQEDIDDMIHQLTRTNLNGGRRKTRRYRKSNRRSRSSR